MFVAAATDNTYYDDYEPQFDDTDYTYTYEYTYDYTYTYTY